MKFDETDTIAFPMSDMSTIYFLLNDDEVVYIGSSESGVCNISTHADKIFNKVEVKFIPTGNLSETKSNLIKKYCPFYNRKLVDGYDIGMGGIKTKIQKKYNCKEFTLVYLKKIIKLLSIRPYEYNGIIYVSKKDCDKITTFIDAELYGLKLDEWKKTLNEISKARR